MMKEKIWKFVGLLSGALLLGGLAWWFLEPVLVARPGPVIDSEDGGARVSTPLAKYIAGACCEGSLKTWRETSELLKEQAEIIKKLTEERPAPTTPAAQEPPPAPAKTELSEEEKLRRSLKEDPVWGPLYR